MRRFLLGFLVAVALAVPITLAAAPAKVVNVTNPMSADLNANGHNIRNVADITGTAGSAIEQNAQGELSMYSAPGAPGAFLAADGGAGALVQVNGQGAGFPGDVNIQPDDNANLRLFHLPSADPHVLNAVWNDGGTLAISAG